MTERINSSFLEKLMVKAMTTDKDFLVLISRVFEKEYFDDSVVGSIFEFSKEYIEEYGRIPPREAILNSLRDNEVREVFEEVDHIEFDIRGDYNYLITETNEYLKDQAIKRAILESVDIAENRDRREEIRDNVERALTKDIKVDLGLDYFAHLGDRLRRIFTATDIRVPTYFPQFDEYINGGFPPFTLSVMVAKIHGFKSNSMANFAARQVMHGHNVVLMTLEMSQDAFAQRFDSIYSLLDINRMYFNSNQQRLIECLRQAKTHAQECGGNLFIKHFPTGEATVRDFKSYVGELLIRDIKPSIFYVDYINLMKSAYKKYGDMYSSVKSIAEELRALSFQFEVPVISVSQINREGSFVGFEEIDFNYIAESMGLPATADFMAIYGEDEDALIYKSELHWKIVKNRLGGRVGETGKFYYDSRNLKMYDETELDRWIADAQVSGDQRELAPPPDQRPIQRRRQRSR